jgi:hypothetical protein
MAHNPSKLLRQAVISLSLSGALACGTDPGLHPSASTTLDPTVPTSPATPPAAPTPPAPAPRVAVRQFNCLGMAAPAQVRQRITGGLTASDEPVNVAYYKSSTSQELVMGAEPQLVPSYDGGYWQQNYGLEAWHVGTTAIATYTLLLPPGPIPLRFDAMGMVDYVGGGSYQDQLTCAIL